MLSSFLYFLPDAFFGTLIPYVYNECAFFKVLAKNDSLDRAIHWLAAALRIDPYATEAFDTLVFYIAMILESAYKAPVPLLEHTHTHFLHSSF